MWRDARLAMLGLSPDGTAMDLTEEQQRRIDEEGSSAPAVPIKEETVTVPLDHFNKDDKRTFEN